jgi:hypothetical protein
MIDDGTPSGGVDLVVVVVVRWVDVGQGISFCKEADHS